MTTPFPAAVPRPVPLEALLEALPDLRYMLELFGVDVDHDMPKVWADRYAHGSPITTAQLERAIGALRLIVVKAYGAS